MLSYDYFLYLPSTIDILRNEKLLKSRAAFTKKQFCLIRTPLLTNIQMWFTLQKMCRAESVKKAIELLK